MSWLGELFFGQGVAHSVLMFAIVIALGIVLGKVKVWGISLGITWILFVGIICSHFGMQVDGHILHFVQEFGLILFVYSVGLQVGPGFFSSFRKGGMTLNMLATGIVLLGVVTTYIIHVVTGLPITTMVGVLSGAVTNTPGLGAAQQAYMDASGMEDPTIALGYAVAYPLGVVGIICSIMLMRVLFRVNLEKENEALEREDTDKGSNAQQFSVRVTNPALFGKDLKEVTRLINRKFVFSRVYHEDDSIELGSSETCLSAGDKLLVVAALQDIDAITAFLGERVEVEWEKLDKKLVSRRIAITKAAVNGKMLGEMKLRNCFGVNVTRVNRAGVDLVARPNLQLQIGDRLTVVGPEAAVNNVAKVLGNSLRRLREPNLVPIFLGIFLGIVLGSIPFTFPGIPQPVKLGLAGGPLIIAILVSRFGPQYGLVTYTTMSANLMLREVGIALFLASVGLRAGNGFVETIINQGGYAWIGYGVIITLVPLIIIGIIARAVYKVNYFTLMGLIAGSMTDPPALAYSNGVAGNDAPSVSYATVYPLTMFLRVLTAQLLILLFA
ncbi:MULTISPECIES: putative transporter [Butyricimonas]|uniref:putative transporter n=1 Tax=Butyricimonas TaxID=574697 RepID=UPI001D084225|nr:MULTISPECIES: putative transporter [Butyricimonas]MCB6974419.1 putative transporter [Butyricimonas synergistica]MCG4521217.1 putative transporter [Butyricimonas sp. DFI.6.44]